MNLYSLDFKFLFMNILHLMPQFPIPYNEGGKIVLFNTFRELSEQGNNVTMVCFSDVPIEKQYLLEANKFGEVIIISHSTKNTKIRIAKSVFNPRSIFFEKHINKKIIKEVFKIVEKGNFDFVQCEHSPMGQLGLAIKNKFGIPFAIRLHNIEYEIWQRYAEYLPKNNPKRIYVADQAKIIKAEEIEIYGKADFCITISELDKSKAEILNPNGTYINSYPGVDINFWAPDNTIKKNPYEMVLATTYNWVHNVDGLKWFLDEVLSLVRVSLPNAFISIIGKNPPSWINEYIHKGVNIVGYLNDIRPNLNQASLYISPLFVGSGIRIKILEAMACGLPIISTSVSAEGNFATENEGLQITNDPKEFAQMCINRLNFATKANADGLAGRKFIEANFSWKENIKVIVDKYKEILESVS